MATSSTTRLGPAWSSSEYIRNIFGEPQRQSGHRRALHQPSAASQIRRPTRAPPRSSRRRRRRLRQRHRMRCSIGRSHHRRGCNIAGEVIPRLARSRRARIPRAVRAANREHPRGSSKSTPENPSSFVASFLRGKNSRPALPPRRAWRGTSSATAVGASPVTFACNVARESTAEPGDRRHADPALYS
jgi:hypothetical protein